MIAESKARLEAEGNALLARMQEGKHRLSVQRAFGATPQEMGEAAVAQARSRSLAGRQPALGLREAT
jgi:hypothetical protein